MRRLREISTWGLFINSTSLIFIDAACLTILDLPPWQQSLWRDSNVLFWCVFLILISSFGQLDILQSCLRRLTKWLSLAVELWNVRRKGRTVGLQRQILYRLGKQGSSPFTLNARLGKEKERSRVWMRPSGTRQKGKESTWGSSQRSPHVIEKALKTAGIQEPRGRQVRPCRPLVSICVRTMEKRHSCPPFLCPAVSNRSLPDHLAEVTPAMPAIFILGFHPAYATRKALLWTLQDTSKGLTHRMGQRYISEDGGAWNGIRLHLCLCQAS